MIIRSCLTGFLLLLCSGVQAESLADVFALARQNDSLIRSQEATYRANQENARIARAALLPQISISASHSDGAVYNKIAPQQRYDTETDSRNLTASQTLFDLARWHNYRSGQQSSSQAEAQFQADQQDLVVRVVAAYTDVLNAIDVYKTARAEEAALARQLEQTDQRYEAGLAAITDVHEARASFDSATVNVLDAKGAVGIAFEAIDTIVGTRVQSIAPLSSDFIIRLPEAFERQVWVEKAVSHNAQLRASELAKAAALQHARAKRADHLPTITATLQKSDTETDADINTFDVNREDEVLSINFNMPLYAGGGLSASRRQAWEQYNAATEQFNYTRRTIIQSARSLHLAVSTDVARVDAQQQVIRSAQSALDATKAGFDAGTRNIVDVLNAERALYNAQRLWHKARYQFINDLLALKKVAGELDQTDIDYTNQFIQKSDAVPRSDFE